MKPQRLLCIPGDYWFKRELSPGVFIVRRWDGTKSVWSILKLEFGEEYSTRREAIANAIQQ